MAYKDLPPLTNEDGDVRELTDNDFLWFIRTQDFPDRAASHEFLRQREKFFRAAEAVGLERESFLPFEPSKPGFVERVTAAFEAVLKAAKHATETKHAAE